MRAPRSWVNPGRGLRHREAINPAEKPEGSLHWAARVNAGADLYGCEIEPLPGSRCGELPNCCQRLRSCPPHRHAWEPAFCAVMLKP